MKQALVAVGLVVLGCTAAPPQAEWTAAQKVAGREQGLSHISGLAVDEKFLYVAMGGTQADQKAGQSGIRKIDLTSGQVSPLADTPPQSAEGGFEAHDRYLYYNTGGQLLRLDKGGGKPEPLTRENVGASIDLAVGQRLYWCNHGSYQQSEANTTAVYSCPKEGGPVTVFAPCKSSPHSLIVDSGRVYWLAGSTLYAQPQKDGAKPLELLQVSPEEGLDELAQDQDNLYFGKRGAGQSRWGLFKIPKSGGAPQLLSKTCSLKPFLPCPDGIFFFDQEGLTTDLLCKLSQGKVAILDRGYIGEDAVLGGNSVYFSSLDTVYAWPRK